MAYVVDDDNATLDSICSLLGAMGIATSDYSDANTFLDNLLPGTLGALVTDVRMPGMGGLELIAKLQDLDPDLPVIVLSGYVDVDGAVKAMGLGAVTVICKPFPEQQLRDAIGKAFALAASRRAVARRKAEVAEAFQALTVQEWGVLDCLDRGLLNKVTASRLGVSIRTVEDRRRRILNKLSAESVASVVHLIDEARRLGVELHLGVVDRGGRFDRGIAS